MGVYIKGMEMPRNCLECDWCVHTIPADNYICYRLNRAVIGVAKEDVNETVNACCPISPVQSHGRLIDADELKALVYANIALFDSAPGRMGADQKLVRAWLASMAEDIDDAPTIIPASEEGE